MTSLGGRDKSIPSSSSAARRNSRSGFRLLARSMHVGVFGFALFPAAPIEFLNSPMKSTCQLHLQMRLGDGFLRVGAKKRLWCGCKPNRRQEACRPKQMGAEAQAAVLAGWMWIIRGVNCVLAERRTTRIDINIDDFQHDRHSFTFTICKSRNTRGGALCCLF